MVFDFDGALKSGFQKGEIVDFLRQQAKSDINWQEIDELKAQAKANNPNLNENAFVFDYLQNGNFNFNSAPASREDTLALIKEQEKQYQNPNLLERGLESISEAALNLTFGLTPTYESQATQKNQKITDEIYKTAVLNGIDAKDLSQKTNYEIAEQKGGFFDNFRINNTNTSNELIKQERLKQSALNKDFADLNPQEKQAFKSDLNVGARAWDYFFSEDEEQFENWKETKRTENLIADYQSAIDDINRLNTYHQNTSLYNTFFGKDSKLKEQYLKDVNNIAAKVGFDGAEFKENGELYLLKDEEAYKVNEEFFKNLPTTLDAIKNEIALGMGGAVAGARAGASVGRIGGVVGAIGGGAVGAVAGAVGDVLSNNAKLDRENNTKEIISHALEAGTLSLAGDAIALGLAKGGKPLLKKAKNVISKASDNIILAGFVRNLPTQNLRAAQKILNNSYTKEEKEALFAFGEEFGGRLKSGETSNTQKLIDFTQDSNLPLKSTALKMLNAINKPTLRQRQLELIELIRADESGSSLAFLTEVANTSPKASKVLGDILNATTYNLQKQLKEIGMDNIEIRQIYENLKNKTKADYNDVMENVLGKIYDSNYKTTLDNKNYLNFRKELENSGILESDAMAFLKDIEANIYNPNGVEFKQLNNALKRLNAYTKSANPNLNEHLKSAVRGFLKEDIKKGIDEIFAQNTQGYADAKRLFESALSDYATMKEIFKVKGIKSLMDSTKTKEAAEESFVKYLQGQGEANKSNYEILTQNLPKEQKENLELGVINQIFNKSLSNGDNGLNVFNSVAFNKEIEGLKDKFTTKGAKDALELIGGFHKLFLNDGEIAYALRPAKTGSKGMSSTIATSIKGATEQKTTSAIMDLLMRNLPELGIPFTPIKFRAFNERIQGAALRYHLLSALNHSVNVEDFKSILQRRNTPNNFNLPTREFLNEFLKQVDEIKTETLKDAENLRAREAESFEKQKMEAQFSTANLSKEQILNNLQDVRFRDTKVKETENDTITRNNHTDNTNNSNISNTNTLDSHLHTTPQGNERVMGDISTQSRVHREGGLRESQELSDIRFTDTKGKEHTLTKETQEQWLKTFGLENLEQSYIPKHSEEIKQALGSKEIRLTKGSLLKLASKQREQYIPQVKETLDNPDFILKDVDDMVILAKKIGDKQYFTSINLQTEDFLISISNAPKKENILKNKVENGAKILYQSPNSESIFYTPELLQTKQSLANKIDNVDSTTNLSKSEVSSATLSPFARAEAEKQARLEIQAKEEAQRELQREARREEIKENQRILQEQKDKESGQSSLNREVDLGDNIKVREIKAPTTSVTLGNNEVLELKYVVVKQEDLKTNFNGNALQPRTQSNPAMIERIATQFKPNLVIGRGGFEDLPILAPDGQVIAGNHRVEGMKQFNQASRKRYEDAIKESFGVELKSDELLLRMPKDELENQKLVSLAFVSNANTNLTYGDKVMASLGKYAKELEMMPRYFGSESVDELSTKVAKSLENNELLPNEEEANLALLGHLAKNSNGENIASVLTRIYQNNNRENFTKIKDMFVKNAGAFHNLINDTGENGLKNLELRPYLLDSINATSQSLRGTRADNFKKLVEKIENVLKTTDENGSNVILQQDSEYYKNLIGEILGASLAKFARQENPANALYEVLKNAKADLIEELSPTLFKEGKGIEKADIYDFLELLISKGEASEVTSRVIDLLPALKEKEKAFNEYIKKVGKKQEIDSQTPNARDLQEQIPNSLQDTIFKDTKGKEHTLTKETQEQWLKTFGLENLEQSYIPKHSEEIKQALGGKEIRLQKGSLLKLVSQGREEFIPQIKEVLDEPDLIIKEPSEEILLAKHLKNEDYFVNVSFDNGEYLVSISNGIKETRNLQNKLNAGAKIIYQSPNANSISQTLLQTSQYSANKIDNVDSSTNLSKSEVFPKRKEFDEYLAENRKYHIDWVDVLDSSPANVSIMREFILDAKKSLENGINKELPQSLREKIQTALDIRPIAEFGTNYAEFYRDGANAIAKILREKQGQVAGAFYKEELGDIDVVWGDSHFGLQHILERRTQDFIKEGLSEAEAKAKAREFVESIPKIIESGKVVKDDKGRLRIEFDNFIVGIKDNWKGKPTNKWIVTSYAKKEGGESLYTSSPITKGETLPLNSKADSTIDKALLSKQGIDEVSLVKVQSKFKYDEKKASDLLEWHKDSSPITKDKDGLPKVFYHGSKAGNIKEFKSEFDESGLGFWFVDDIEYAKRVDDNLYEVFLNVKNPIDFRGGDNPNYPYKLQEEMDKLGLSLERYTYQTEKTKEFLQSKGYDALILDGSNKEHPFIAIFDSNQIKHINNKGSYTDSSGNITSTKPKDTQAEHRYFNEASPNIYQSNAHIGAGLVSGTLAGVERDENGNIVGFDPSKFALGFLGGAVGSKAVSQGFKVIKDNPQLKESLKQELANTLAKGWEASVDKYPILKALEPMKIMQSQKGRIAQAGHLINKIEKQEIHTQREATKELLSKIVGQDITNANDGRIAQVSKKNIAKMLSDKAIAKSVNNGFSELEHIEAVKDIQELYTRARFIETHKDLKHNDPAIIIHRYKAEVDSNTEALITLKETIEGKYRGNKIYTLELEGLEKSASKSHESLTLPKHNAVSRNTTDSFIVTPTAKPESNSTIDSKLLSKVQSKFKYDEKKASDLLEWHKDSSPITKDKDGLPKVFYRGSKVKGLEEFKSEFDESGLGFWFNANENRAKAFAKSSSDKLYPVFLYIKKPFDLNQSINTKNVKELSELLGEDLHKYVATNKESLQKELDKATNSKDFAVIEGRGLMLESNKKPSEYAYAYNGKWYVNLYNETDLQREGLQKLLPFMQKAQNLNQTKTITELLNEKEMGEYQKNTHRFLQNLKAKGYDSILPNGKASDDDIIVFDSNQIKHIDNKGSYTDSSGNITSTKPKDTQAEHRYFNEASPNIYQTNPHIGSGLVSGTLAGVERDENGNIIGFDPSKFALGFLGGAVGSKAVSQGFKVIKDNPQLKESLKQELANTLAKGWEATTAKYPILKALEPMKIMQSQKGRIAQAGHLINKIENTHLQQAKENLKAIDTSTLTKERQEILKVFLGEKSQTSIKGKDLKDIHTLEQGSRKKGAKKILIKHYGVEKTGGLSDNEILDISKVIKKGKINTNTFSEGEDFIRYGYDLNENGVNYRVVVDEYNNGKKIFDYYSDRNFTDFKGVYSPELPNTQSNFTTETIKMQFKNKALQKSDFIYYKPYERDNESYNSNTRLEFLNQNDIMPSKNGKDMQDIRTKLLDIEQKINYSYLKNIASKIPSPLTQDEFLAQFPNKNRVHIKTPISEVEIQPKLIWEHLQKQSNKKEDRNSISGAIIQTLQEPLFITKDKKEAFYFYRPFLDSKGVLNLVSVQIPKSNRLQYKTSYIASKQRMMKMLKEYDLVYERF
ncbi:PBECR2 nuclease fold domain-containing protein [Helicobacter pullorum]|uniref:ADP-ribosyltransferase-containing protein n=1 Tax=Helicobacter pullorum TaxID=35818 RepID=UPI001E131B28|nr:PBECR2 nuclease fold domain-containing protein [Helicobacter pullorum]HJF82882.1 DUF3519 domain-containing protein [Helicobacter pullorum]